MLSWRQYGVELLLREMFVGMLQQYILRGGGRYRFRSENILYYVQEGELPREALKDIMDEGFG